MILYLLHSTDVLRPTARQRMLMKSRTEKPIGFFLLSNSLPFSSFCCFYLFIFSCDSARSFDFNALMILNTFKCSVYFFHSFSSFLPNVYIIGDLFIIGMCAYFTRSKRERVHSARHSTAFVQKYRTCTAASNRI